MRSVAMLVLVAAASLSAGELSSPAGSACAAAAGTCVLGGVSCTADGAASIQDCNPDENPGGAFCCLDPADASTTPHGCTWPASLDEPDAYTTACYAAASYPGGDANECTANEYAVICGGPGPATPPPLPSGCRAVLSGSGGNNAGCCPCEE